MKQRERAPTPADIAALSRRITRAAGPVLLRKRHRAIPESEYIAAWTRPLLPIAFVCTFAGAVFLLFAPPLQEREPNAGDAILNAATNSITAPQLIDIVLHSPDEDVLPSAAPRRTR